MNPIQRFFVFVLWLLLTVILIGTLVVLFFFRDSVDRYFMPPEEKMADGLHSMQVALERFAVAYDGKYPPSIEAMIDDFLLYIPENPYTRSEMRDIQFGELPCQGNFTYIPIYDGDNVIGYYLLGYGSEDEPGLDVNMDGNPDHVITVLETSVGRSAERPTLVEMLE